MRFLGHLSDDLFIKRHAALVPANLGQQSVIEPFTPTEPATGKIEGYARHKNQVQLV
jgi:hypothetical protein